VQLHDYVLFSANTGLRPDEARRLQFRDIKIVEEEGSGQPILEIEVRGKRGVGYCKSIPGAVLSFEVMTARLRPARADESTQDEDGSNTNKNRPEEVRLPAPTDLIFPKWQRELFKTIWTRRVSGSTVKDGREPLTACGTRIYVSLDGRRRHLSDRQKLPHQRRDEREILRVAYKNEPLMPPRSTSCGQNQRRRINQPKTSTPPGPSDPGNYVYIPVRCLYHR